MNSKERILATISGSACDKVPCSYYATDTVTQNLMKHLNAGNLHQLIDMLHIDMFNIRGFIDPAWKGPFPKEKNIGDGITQNHFGWRMKRVKTDLGFEEFHCDHIFANAQTPDDIEKFDWPKADWFDFSKMPEQIKQYDGLALMVLSASVFQHPTMVRGLDNFLCDMLINPPLAHTLMDKYTDFYLAYFDKMFSACPGKITVLKISDDIGMQDRLLIRMGEFREFVKPRVKKLVDMAHSHNVKIMFHSCGSIVEFIEDLIDIGVDILDPIQVRAKNMEPAGIKREFGDRICLHGAIDIQWTLPKGSTEDVKKEVQERIDVLGKGGKYIIAPCHALQQDVPMENIAAMYKEIQEYQR
jgi:uroporphyrinogen decarboxylase